MTPWLLFGGFVSLLAGSIILTIRALLSGKIVAGRHYDDARADEAGWRQVAETALSAVAEQSGQIARLVVTVDQLTAVTRETQGLVRQLMTPERAK